MINLALVKNYTDVLSPEFYARPTVDVARNLLGTKLCRRFPDERIETAMIVEVEAYTQDDPACHAFKGLTERCRVMFGPAGYAYVYFIYGMYNCLNVVTEAEGTPGAVLIRAIALEPGGNGPGKLCRQWQIDRSFNGVDLRDPGSPLWIVRGEEVPDQAVQISQRIGLSVAQERQWRFFIKDHASVSGKRTKVRSRVAGTRSA